MSNVYSRLQKPTSISYLDSIKELRAKVLLFCMRVPEKYQVWITNYIAYYAGQADIKAYDVYSDDEVSMSDSAYKIRKLKEADHSLDQLLSNLCLLCDMINLDEDLSYDKRQKLRNRVFNELTPEIMASKGHVKTAIKQEFELMNEIT